MGKEGITVTREAGYRWGRLCDGVDSSQAATRRPLARAVCEVVTRWRERRFARQSARRVLSAYRVVHALHPELKGERLYVASLSSASGLDEAEARARVTRASRSFAAWPAPRAVRLRDVVEYVVVSDYMAREPRPRGVLSNIGNVVASIVPGNL